MTHNLIRSAVTHLGLLRSRRSGIERAVALAVVSLAAGLPLLGGGSALAQQVIIPPGSNTRSVAEFGAIPNDGVDDTAAFNAALAATVGTWQVLYVPDGVYEFSGPINWSGVRNGAHLKLQGQSQTGTILRLKPSSAGFDGASGQTVFLDVYNGNSGNAFGNYIQDLTVEVGAGNPGANAVQFHANNTGAMRRVTIRSLETSALTGANSAGLLCTANSGSESNIEPGPFLLQDITIEGFSRGFLGAPQQYCVTMENITLTGQTVYGLEVYRLPLSIRNLISRNNVPAFHSIGNPGAAGHLVLEGGTFTRLPGAPGASAVVDAIVNDVSAGTMVLKGVNSSGYRYAVKDDGVGATRPDGAVGFYASDSTLTKFGFSNAALGGLLDLPVEATPRVPLPPVSQWANVADFGAGANDAFDDTAAIQAALNSGKPVVYLPNGTFSINDTLTVGPAVTHIIGFMTALEVRAGLWQQDAAIFRIPPGSQPIVTIENFRSSGVGLGYSRWIQHDAANTLVIKDGDLDGYRNGIAGGKVFLENVVGHHMEFRGQRVWARQLNPEGTGTKVSNIGGDLWVLGWKTEGAGTNVETSQGGRTEILGGLSYPVAVPGATPLFSVDNASLAVSLPESCYYGCGQCYYTNWVSETRGGNTQVLTRSDLSRGHSECGAMLTLFATDLPDSSPPSAPGAPSVVSATETSVTITWSPASDAQSGVARYSILRGGVPVGGSVTNSVTLGALPRGVASSYQVVAINGRGVSSTPSASATIAPASDTTAPVVVRAEVLGASTVRVTFSEPLGASSLVPARFSVDGVPATAVVAAPDATAATITLGSPLPVGVGRQLVITNLADTNTPSNVTATATIPLTFGPALTVGPTSGLRAEIYNTRDFTGAALVRTDPGINFDFGFGGPAPGINADNFSIRWSGRVFARYSERYTFITRSDDGIRVFVDGRSVVRAFFDQGASADYSGQIDLEGGKWYDILVEYYEGGYSASAKLEWQSASQAREVIPQQYLDTRRLLTTVRNTTGLGADTTLERANANADRGAQQSIVAMNDDFQDYFYHQASLVRFDLRSLDLASVQASKATLAFTLTGFGSGDGIRPLNIFGLRSGDAAEQWRELSPGQASWANMPGLTGTGSMAEPANWIWLGELVVNNTNYAANSQPDLLTLSTDKLRDFLNADADGVVTILVKRASAGFGEVTALAAREYIPEWAPALKLELTERCPTITQQPASVSVTAGGTVAFSVAASGGAPLAFRWFAGGVALSDGPTGSGAVVSGAGTSTLTITGAQAADAGAYVVVVSNSCGQVTSGAASVVVAPAGCSPADVAGGGSNGTEPDGVVDGTDFVAFINSFAIGDVGIDPLADINADGTIDGSDFVAFINAFALGC